MNLNTSLMIKVKNTLIPICNNTDNLPTHSHSKASSYTSRGRFTPYITLDDDVPYRTIRMHTPSYVVPFAYSGGVFYNLNDNSILSNIKKSYLIYEYFDEMDKEAVIPNDAIVVGVIKFEDELEFRKQQYNNALFQIVDLIKEDSNLMTFPIKHRLDIFSFDNGQSYELKYKTAVKETIGLHSYYNNGITKWLITDLNSVEPCSFKLKVVSDC